MDKPLLSFCIPTYNRVMYLRDLLPCVLEEVGRVNGDVPRVEVLVSNNASTDETDEYVRSLSSPVLTYQRNPSNIGGANNFRACIDRARGVYVWLFGDDDMFEPGGITRLLDCLNSHQPSLVVLRDVRSSPCAAKDTMVYSEYGECLRHELKTDPSFAIHQTLITANVFRKDVYDLHTAKAKATSAYAQMYALAAGLRRCEGKVVVLNAVMRTRPQRAQFADGWPKGLCVRLGVYLWHVARLFDVPRLRRNALCLFANLPAEILACCARWISPRFGRN